MTNLIKFFFFFSFFNDKFRLLELYHRALEPSLNTLERLAVRMSADIWALMFWASSDADARADASLPGDAFPPQLVEDELGPFFRLLFGRCQYFAGKRIGENDYELQKALTRTSYQLRSIMPGKFFKNIIKIGKNTHFISKIDKKNYLKIFYLKCEIEILESNRFENRSEKLLRTPKEKFKKLWYERAKIAIDESEIAWIESGNKVAGPIEIVQQIHAKILNEFAENVEIGGEMKEKFEQIIEGYKLKKG